MASAPLLAQVAGLNKTLARNIVTYRDENGEFTERKQLLKVARLGPKAYEQAAGFLRILNGGNPLDASSVHPEAYSLVESIAKAKGQALETLVGNSELLKSVKAEDFITEIFGLPTVTDILAELDKPGRDPRGEFKTAVFKEGIEQVKDLKPEMILEGVVTNVTNFGAFVDIGVHQDGLVHISSLTEKFVSDPHTIVKAGDVVKVKVMEIDVERKRIALSMRLDEKVGEKSASRPSPSTGGKSYTGNNKAQNRPKQKAQPANAAMGNAFADALAKLKK
jgi:uncharacterized protein